MSQIGTFLWRLLPGNPILLRVVEAGGKRRRDMFVRCGYLGLLIAIVIFSLFSGGAQSTGIQSLSDLAKTSALLFKNLSYFQLGLVALLAPIFTAGAITQEKDNQTYDILLATPLSNGQIVLGALLSRFFFVFALLLSGVPVFSITQVFGGVAIVSIVLSFLIAAATAFVTGALAMAIAVFKVGTRRTIFSFYLFIMVYLVGIYFLDQLDYFHPFIDKIDPTHRGTSWLTGIHPFLAMRSVLNDKTYLPPIPGDLPDKYRYWPMGYYLSNPASFYVSFMFFFSFLLVTPSIFVMRHLAQSSRTIKMWIAQKLHLSTGDRTQKPRTVWMNPIAWREARTKVSAARGGIVRYGFILAGLAGAIVILVLHSTEKEVDKYIDSNCYDPVQHTLIVRSVLQNPMVYNIKNNSNITVKKRNNAVDISDPAAYTFQKFELRDKFERLAVISISTTPDPTPQPNGKSRTYVSLLQLSPIERRLSIEDSRQWLLGAVVLEFCVILLIVTNASASTVTREKEDGTLDLLLTTPITSRYYIWGKLRGLVSFVIPLLAVPIGSVLIFVFHDIILSAFTNREVSWVVLPEALIIMPGTLILVAAFASILGMQMSLRFRTTVMAVMSSIGVVAGICLCLGFCGANVIDSKNLDSGGVAIGTFSPITQMTLLINPWKFAATVYGDPGSDAALRNRIFATIFAFVSMGIYTALIWSMYKSMVKNFDMTIRKQSR